ncbi:MAG: C cytochrome precursor [Verrucomicrobia bacterium]|nr:C cytochrome precursor [Verrucomicrobiota bacterium]
MTSEWALFFVLLLAGLLPFRRKGKERRAWVLPVALALGSLSMLGGAIRWGVNQDSTRANEQRYQHVPREKPNAGYVTSDRCQSCHPDEYESWRRSFHRTMTQYADADSVAADFDDVKLEARGETYRLQRRGNELWVEMPDPDWKADQSRIHRNLDWSRYTDAPRALKRVSMATGSHHLQKFWVSSERGNLQYDLPFTFLIEDKRWVLREDSIIRDPQLPLLIQVWNVNCIKCHTTAAQPRRDSETGILNTRVGEMGIACEACHGPAQEHIEAHHQPIRRYQARIRHADPTIVNPLRLSAKKSSEVCGQCHAIKLNLDRDWEQNGSRFRPGDDLEKSMALVLPAKGSSIPGLAEALKDSEEITHFFWSDGMVRIAGREYTGLVQSPCFERGTMTCFSCHSIHRSDPNDQLAVGMTGHEACLQCHTDYRNRVSEHTRHAAESSGSECYNCHMPHTNWGLLGAIRSHQITSPTVQSSLQTGRPNACNFCHLDKTLDWTARYLSEWYKTPPPMLNGDEASVSAAVLWALKGDAAQRALMAWSMGWEPAQTASGRRWMIPILAQLLDDPYAAVRYRAARTLRRNPGFEDFGYDYVGPAADRAQARERALDLWRKTPALELDRTGPEILILPDGRLSQEKFDALLRQRNNRSVFIVE